MRHLKLFEEFVNEYGSGPKYKIAKVVNGKLKEELSGTLEELSNRLWRPIEYAADNVPKFRNLSNGKDIGTAESIDDLLEIIRIYAKHIEKKITRIGETVYGPMEFFDVEVGDKTLLDTWVQDGFPPVEEFKQKHRAVFHGKKFGL